MEFIEYDKNGYIKWEKIYSSYNEVKDREDLQIASELSNSKNASDEDLSCSDEPENFRLKI